MRWAHLKLCINYTESALSYSVLFTRSCTMNLIRYMLRLVFFFCLPPYIPYSLKNLIRIIFSCSQL